jgi:hypothetical protein
METLLVVTRREPGRGPEAEGVTVITDIEGVTILELDDGGRLEFEPTELLAALMAPMPTRQQRAA